MALQVAVHGAPGRMSQRLCSLIAAAEDLDLVAAVGRADHSKVGELLSELPGFVNVRGRLSGVLPEAGLDVVIDFSHPDAVEPLLAACRSRGMPLLCGTTGLSEETIAQLRDAGADIPVLIAPNTSFGINLLRQLVRQVATSLDAEYDIEVVEAHHRWKKDAPSGTALMLGEAAAAARGSSLKELAQHGREGAAAEREVGEIGFHALRLGDVAGEHRVYFSAPGERIELAHAAHSRDTFAQGALRAARWLVTQGAGCYTMDDVLGFGAAT